MGDENPIRTLRDYSRPSHEVYRNTIKLPDGNNVVPLRSDTIWLVQNECSFHGSQSEDPNQHLKNFIKLMDSLDLDLHVKNFKESWEIIENLALYDHHGWNDSRDIAKLVKAISLPRNTSKMPDRQILELEDQISYLLKRPRLKPETSSTHVSLAYAKVVVDMKKEMEDETNDEPIRNIEEEIKGDKIEDQVEMPRYNDSLLATHLGKIDYETYISLPLGPIYDTILKKKITKKEDMGGYFVIPCNIGGLKYMDALGDQGSDVNVMHLSIYNRLTSEKPVGTNIRLSIAIHSYIFPLGIAEDVLVEIAGYIYPIDFMILDVKEDKKKPFILGTPFLTTAKSKIRLNTGTITLKSGKNKINFFKTPGSFCRVKEGTENGIDPTTPNTTVSRLILEWEEIIKLHQEKEMEFNQWRSKVFNDERSTFVNEGCEVDDKGGVT
ncbi:MAK10-like protein [Tanacetum coccineum]